MKEIGFDEAMQSHKMTLLVISCVAYGLTVGEQEGVEGTYRPKGRRILKLPHDKSQKSSNAGRLLADSKNSLSSAYSDHCSALPGLARTHHSYDTLLLCLQA